MRINVIEKFDLYERLGDLSKKLNEHEESQNICNKTIHSLKSGFTTGKFNLYLEQLRQYDWITEVESFLEDVETFLNENKYGLELERIMEKLSGINTYNPLVETIKSLVVLDESEIKLEITKLAKFKFEPNVRRLVESFEKSEFNIQETAKAKITSSPISPVMTLDEGFIFSSNSGNYMVSGDLTKVDKYEGKVTREFAMAKKVLEMFKFKGNNTFEAVLPKATIVITTSDSSEESTTMTINESKIESKTQLTKVLKNAGLVNYTDTKTRGMVEFMFEKADSFVEIDFVKSVETINENFEVFKMANNEVSISKFDKKTRGFVLESLDIEDIEDLSESLKKSYDLDFDNVLEGLHINIASLEFKGLVENIKTSSIVDMSKADVVYSKIEEANAKYNELNVENRKNVEGDFIKLQEMETLVKSEEVSFLVETKKALVEKLDEGEELSESLIMLNAELTKLV
tara:strand:+ start:814 stop:2190 length:1377 start_codon:yes stop_codon:yes gene_type:complete